MIVSPAGGWIFLHIPKTGGTALALALEGCARPDDILIGDTPEARRRRPRLRGLRAAGRLWKHARLADIEGVVPRAAFPRMLLFAITRNPWERMASYYHWLRRQGFAHPQVRLAQACDFRAFLDHPETGALIRATPCGAYLRDGAGVEHPALWLRHERLDRDAAALGCRLGLALPPLRWVNASDRPADWRRLYTDAMAARVADLCAEDIARFGYRFAPD